MNSEDVTILNITDKDFKSKLDFEIWSTHSCSDYRNDRERPYNGQPHTDDGERGKTEVKGVTFRDIRDCLIKAMIASSPPPEKYFSSEEFLKCYDFSKPEPNHTQYLLDNQEEYVSTKVEVGNWRPQDVYKLDWKKIDPLAIANNLSCEIEKMMGIYPNVPKIAFSDED